MPKVLWQEPEPAPIHFKQTQYGFEYGDAKITRLFSDKKKGWVAIGLGSSKYKNSIQLYVTKTGKVRIFLEGTEWFPEAPKDKPKSKK